jgi:hypothetical protein
MPYVECRICSKEFYIKPSHYKIGWGKYCSIACRSKAQNKGKMVKCAVCEKEIYRSPGALKHSISGKSFCSKSCQTIWRNITNTGNKNNNWKNGERAYRSIIKRSGKRQICYLCRTNDTRVLMVHHKDNDRTNNRLDNLIWLCCNCHYLAHHYKEINVKIT